MNQVRGVPEHERSRMKDLSVYKLPASALISFPSAVSPLSSQNTTQPSCFPTAYFVLNLSDAGSSYGQNEPSLA